jgi:hypothetical protein
MGHNISDDNDGGGISNIQLAREKFTWRQPRATPFDDPFCTTVPRTWQLKGTSSSSSSTIGLSSLLAVQWLVSVCQLQQWFGNTIDNSALVLRDKFFHISETVPPHFRLDDFHPLLDPANQLLLL